MSPTPEQQAIISSALAGGSLMIEAYAGTGKSSTLRMLAQALPAQNALALAFNVKNKKDMEALLPEWVTVKTFNGLGHSAWGRALGRPLTLDERKLGRLTTQGFKAKGVDSGGDAWELVRGIVTEAMKIGLVPSEFDRRSLVDDPVEVWRGLCSDATEREELWALAKQVLVASIREGLQGTISFDDQVYLPTLFDGAFQRYGLILVDEAQDLNGLNHQQIRRSLASDGRLIVVGDSRQAIYGFRGAHSESMNALRGLRPQWTDLQLSLTFRCPKRMVELVSDHAEGFTAAQANPEGEIHDLRNRRDADQEELPWSWEEVQRLAHGDIAVVCRNNAPLLSMAFRLLKQGVGVQMLGRDIGKSLIALSRKIVKRDTELRDRCIFLVKQWQNEQVGLAQVNEEEYKIDGINDRAECLLAVLGTMQQQATAWDLRAKLKSLFESSHGQVTLATGHKAKGLEWDTVVYLDSFRCPSKWARKAGGSALQQELNLDYVIKTRAKRTLVFADAEQFEGEG